ncbi:conserved exported hypothetical protein [Vibrio chagasii]|uniref:hypothetical protein n=1 Tax=Vibrio TaxID=662 RepID=UPI000E32D082|nr:MULTISPECIES: hypothetical protein [Vibrio]MCG9561353.1 hypothetical protein [Vibrio chagasii]MCG9673666.1 hypothetical protein [Vibrio chagasii]CAH6938732.1 conserved exported hypothetical protein [Vibrio chagasii]CAH6954421.1 conserved exported hypothetical protein [Vibrio chagasii]CAH6989639.1 conserved exported hypothetical protein [Vibrio chagasii]
MLDIKDKAPVSVLLVGLAVSLGAEAESSKATVLWSGTVPTVTASDTLVITGLAGDTTALYGTITPSPTGVFKSDTIVLESHVNDGDATSPVIGDLTAANWRLVDASVTFDGAANPAQNVEVNVNGAPTAIGDVISAEETISTQVNQTATLPEAEVGGATVQATITVLADIV